MVSKPKTIATILVIALAISVVQLATAGETLGVMSFNIWVGGEGGGQPLDQTIKVIQASQADVVGLQETLGNEHDGKRTNAARAVADKLSWHYFGQKGDGPAIVSRYAIVDHTPSKLGAAFKLPSGQKVWLFNVHFAHAPYQPYQLLKISYAHAPFIETAEQAVFEARKARGPQVAELLKEVEIVRPENCPIAITGDFNEPSALDWTNAVKNARLCPAIVAWPTTQAVLNAGFTDAYRKTHPDVLKWPGHTWTPTTAEDDLQDRHDRIDFVFISGEDVTVEKCDVVGERPERANIVVSPYPSDHRAVVATLQLD